MEKSRLELYDRIIEKCQRFERKGKSMPHTTANGYMFSALNKDGEIGIRFSKDVQEKYIEAFQTTYFKSYGSIMKGYVLIPESLLEDINKVSELLNESYDYVMSLAPKTTKN